MPISEARLIPLPPAQARVPRNTEPEPSREIVVRVSDLSKDFDGRPVLGGVEFQLERGRVYSVIGPSGCGKTTLLRCLLGLTRPDAGVVELLGVDIAAASEPRVDAVRRQIGVVFQSSALMSSMSIAENIALPLRQHTEKTPRQVKERVQHCLELVGMKDAGEMRPAELSGGMRKRCALARAIVLEPQLLFLDEPTSGADPVTSAMLDDLVLDLTRRLGCTAISVTHDMRSAFRLSHEILMLWKGRIHHRGPAASFIEAEDPVINQFVQGRRHGPLSES